ncbi:hypothetical protein ABIA39_003332 [Nocardia sp. GAS34]|uniref:hypothetical protein n=1 Tax=unclassified Nocardia TaxID=2637762 RepID=UPI003D1F1006
MDRLGYQSWTAQGGDWGALISSAIGRLADPAKLIGIHINWALADPAKLTELGGPTEDEQRYLARIEHSSQAEVGYAIEQGTKPQTLGYGLTDSPAGQLAWIVEKFKTWSDCGDDLESSFTKDELLDNAMVYWTCAAAASSARLYWHSLESSLGSFDEVPAPSENEFDQYVPLVALFHAFPSLIVSVPLTQSAAESAAAEGKPPWLLSRFAGAASDRHRPPHGHRLRIRAEPQHQSRRRRGLRLPPHRTPHRPAAGPSGALSRQPR